jgi:SAM-dependent methyltransferase
VRSPVYDELAVLWPRLMRAQVELAFAAEVPFFCGCSDWRLARRVLDLGCGTGEYLSSLRACFPDKLYTGIECDPLYAGLARQQLSADEGGATPVRIVTGDLFSASGEFDALVVRLVAQHLPEPERIFEVARRLLSPTGTLVVVESVDAERCFIPAIPEIEDIFRKFRAARRTAGCDRDAGRLLVERARSHGFRLHNEMTVRAATTPNDRHALFVDTYATVFGILRLNYGVEADFAAAERALHAWRDTPGAYAHIGVQLACYRR